MRRYQQSLLVLMFVAAAASETAIAQTPSAGLISAEDGGASGYQHGFERSRFVTGARESAVRRVEENGFVKMVGPAGVFAVDLRNGLALAVQSGGSNKGETGAREGVSTQPYQMDPEKHDQQVTEYFVGAGIPRDQVGGVHTNTYLSASGSTEEQRPVAPKIDGYASIIERKIDKFSIVDSSAWARMDEQGLVISELVYWPPIPAKVLSEARRLEEQVAASDQLFVRRLPPGLPPGRVVIRHSAATEDGPFEAYASYDVVERREAMIPALNKALGDVRVVSVTVRHFDGDGNEIRLPQERRNHGADFPPKSK